MPYYISNLTVNVNIALQSSPNQQNPTFFVPKPEIDISNLSNSVLIFETEIAEMISKYLELESNSHSLKP